jgi:dihydroorotase
MSKLHCLGMSLPEVIGAAAARPAEALRRPELGTLAPGAVGDAAVLDLTEGSFDYVDVMGEHITGERRLEVRHVIVGGALWHSAGSAA